MFKSKVESDEVTALFSAVLALDTVEECYRFFDDLCTLGELKAIAQRWHVARLLDRGVTYSAIAEATGASTATVSRVNKCLVYGAEGYRHALDRLSESAEAEEEK